MILYRILSRLFPLRSAPANPECIVLILPCCIGDVVLATATLKALRRGYPQAHITWAVGSWSKPAVEHHDLLDAVLDTGPEALPVRSPSGLWRFADHLRAGRFDLAVSLVRSPLMSLAVLLSGIPYRAGLDSDGRGFGYTLRIPLDPRQPRHEAEVYLDVARALGLDVEGCWANVPVRNEDDTHVRVLLAEQGIGERFVVLNPAGGRNPGMIMDAKRWPAANFAQLAGRLASQLDLDGVVLVAGPGDEQVVASVQSQLDLHSAAFVGKLSFGQLTALACQSLLYIGNDTGLTHLAAAAGARTAMILGPSDPARYAPFAPNAIALWKPTTVHRSGVAGGAPPDWNWERDGIGVDEVEQALMKFLDEQS